MSHKDPEQRKIWQRQYREKNRESIRAKEKEYYHKVHKHKSYIKEEQAKFRRTPQSRFVRAKKKAEYRGVPFLLTFEEYTAEIQKSCYYCDNKLGTPSIAGVGLDQIVPGQGYVMGNVCSCCYTCNRIKWDDFSVEETKIAVRAVIAFREAKANGKN